MSWDPTACYKYTPVAYPKRIDRTGTLDIELEQAPWRTQKQPRLEHPSAPRLSPFAPQVDFGEALLPSAQAIEVYSNAADNLPVFDASLLTRASGLFCSNDLDCGYDPMITIGLACSACGVQPGISASAIGRNDHSYSPTIKQSLSGACVHPAVYDAISTFTVPGAGCNDSSKRFINGLFAHAGLFRELGGIEGFMRS